MKLSKSEKKYNQMVIFTFEMRTDLLIPVAKYDTTITKAN